MSAIATILIPSPALAAWLAAPLPRPPQPTRPTFSTSLPAAWTAGSTAAPAAVTAAVVAAVFRKSRREVGGRDGFIAQILLRSGEAHGKLSVGLVVVSPFNRAVGRMSRFFLLCIFS